VVLDPDSEILGLDDSKRLSPGVRHGLDGRIRRLARGVAVGLASPAEIDALGIARANDLAMRRALDGLRQAGVEPDLLVIDAVHLPGAGVEQRSFVRGDQRVAAIAAASIVAKVARDRFMDFLHRVFPYYGFDGHRGYGTPAHLAALRRHGPSPVHRLTFDRVLPVGEGKGAESRGARRDRHRVDAA
jgi:ribonuclease HII